MRGIFGAKITFKMAEFPAGAILAQGEGFWGIYLDHMIDGGLLGGLDPLAGLLR